VSNERHVVANVWAQSPRAFQAISHCHLLIFGPLSDGQLETTHRSMLVNWLENGSNNNRLRVDWRIFMRFPANKRDWSQPC